MSERQGFNSQDSSHSRLRVIHPPAGPSGMVDFTPAWSLPDTSTDNLEHRFKEYKKSDNYNPRLIWDEECVKIIISAKHPLLRAFGFLLVSVVCVIITAIISWPESGITAFFGFVFLMMGLAGLRGNKTLRIHENHLETRFDRMNSGSTGVENPDSNSTEIKRKDITAINYCVLTIAHTQHHNDGGDSFDSTRGSQTTTYEKVDATRILLALTDEMKEYEMDDDENPWLDIRSKTKEEAEDLADALNFLICLNSD